MEQIECPSEDQLVSYLRRDQGEAEVTRIEEHLVVCRACRLIILSQQAVPVEAVEDFILPAMIKQEFGRLPHQQQSFLTRWPKAPALAIAAMLLIAITAGGLWRLNNKTEPQNARSETFRADRKRQVSLSVVSPTENAVVPASDLEFKWTPEADALRYTVVVLDEAGNIVQQAETTANSLLIKTKLLQSGKKYFWRVRAKLTDGTETETTPTVFYINSK